MPDFVFQKTTIEGLKVVYPRFFNDERGYFLKSVEQSVFANHGLPTKFYEEYESLSCKGTLRGIHFQTEHPQGKLVHVCRGSVWTLALDLRKESATFGKWEGFELSGDNHKMVYIPAGFGAGFLALEDETIYSCKCTDCYCPEAESGIRWDDKELAIAWPLSRVDQLTISEKDLCQKSYREYLEEIGKTITQMN